MPKKATPKRAQEVLYELMKRDPLGQQLTDLIVQLYPGDQTEHDDGSLVGRLFACEGALCQKYGVRSIYIPDPVVHDLVKAACSPEQFRRWAEVCWCPMGARATLTHTLNWVPPGTIRFVYKPDALEIQTSDTHPTPPPGESPTLTVTVDLSQVTKWDLERLTTQFRHVLREALDTLPPAWTADRPELAFLKTISQDKLAEDLQRYDLFMRGLKYREIADQESQETGKSPSVDSIGKSVSRMYLTIHGKPLRARRRRLDSPAEGMEVYTCPEHPAGDCTAQCSYHKDYMRRFNATAPGPDSGMGHRALSLTAYEEPEDSKHRSERPRDKSRLRRHQRP